MTDDYTKSLSSDWEKVSNYWEARSKAQSEQRQKVDPSKFPKFGDIYEQSKQRPDPNRPDNPYHWEGQGMTLPPGSRFLPEKGDVINGGKKE